MDYQGLKLDRFQIEAIDAIKKRQTAVVAAPTGAGKTVIAKYALETSLLNDERIIYAAPIKALSDQKFRDISGSSNKVGIITRDYSINPQAPILIMTTKIFRNTIFESPQTLLDVRYVILDEVQFINDDKIERGTGWEESIIFAPEWIEFLCLSATIPNLTQFAAWISSVRDRDVRIIHEQKRPVPLELNFFAEKLGITTLDELRSFKNLPAKERRELISDGKTDIISIIRDEGKLPCLYFSMSRKRCEELACDYMQLALLEPEKYSLLSAEEAEEAVSIYDELCLKHGLSIGRTAALMREFVENGIAYHHAGRLPQMKSVIEKLFALGFLRLIFVTEAFAIGINMPVRTVVMDGLEKFDGNRRRHIRAREFHQMSGRAGRRGLDEKGYAYVRVNPFEVELPLVETTTTGEIEALESQLNLSYSVILNLYERHGRGIYALLEHSFKRFQMMGPLSEIEQKLSSLGQVGVISCLHDNPSLIEEYKKLTDVCTKEKNNFKRESRRARREFKRDKGALNAAIDELRTALAEFERQRADIPCHICPERGKCMVLFQKNTKIKKTSSNLIERKEKLEGDILDNVARKLTFLESLGYIKGETITPKGQFASRIHGFVLGDGIYPPKTETHEIQTTEIICNGYFDIPNEIGINIIAAAIVFQAHPDAFYQKLDWEQFDINFAELDRLIQNLQRRQVAFGIDEPFKLLDASLSSIVSVWCKESVVLNGCIPGERASPSLPFKTKSDFDELSKYTDADEGDIITGLSQTINLLRQIEGAVCDEYLKAKVKSAISLIKVDITDAEKQLRMEVAEGLKIEDFGIED